MWIMWETLELTFHFSLSIPLSSPTPAPFPFPFPHFPHHPRNVIIITTPISVGQDTQLPLWPWWQLWSLFLSCIWYSDAAMWLLPFLRSVIYMWRSSVFWQHLPLSNHAYIKQPQLNWAKIQCTPHKWIPYSLGEGGFPGKHSQLVHSQRSYVVEPFKQFHLPKPSDQFLKKLPRRLCHHHPIHCM